MKAAAGQQLGVQLAQQHRITTGRFGWHRQNTIGSTPQCNDWCDDWQTFFRERRLRFQLELARRNGHGDALLASGERLLQVLPALIGDHRPAPSLLHGDLWSGNTAMDADGVPVIFDPAVYFGDREADLAMARLFGGFGREFLDGYELAWPLPPGAEARVDLYNLYHVLNHLNLFGTGYLERAMRMIDSLLLCANGRPEAG